MNDDDNILINRLFHHQIAGRDLHELEVIMEKLCENCKYAIWIKEDMSNHLPILRTNLGISVNKQPHKYLACSKRDIKKGVSEYMWGKDCLDFEIKQEI